MKKKDNLTDIVEHLPKDKPQNQAQNNADQQVTNIEGDFITLGEKERVIIQDIIKVKMNELADKFIAEHKADQKSKKGL